MANEIVIRDFNLFIETMKSAAKLVDSAKFLISENGLEIYGVRGIIARCELTTNAIYSNDQFSFAIENLAVFNKVLQTVKDENDSDFSKIRFYYEAPHVKITSKKFKTKLSTADELKISKWISKKVTTDMSTVFEFTTTSDMIKRILSSAYITSNPKDARVYLETKDDMENNVLYGTLGNRDNNINSEATFKLGLITEGTWVDKKAIIIDLERLNLFNTIQSNDIKITFTNFNFLLYKTKITGENGSYFNLNIYNTIMKA